MPATLHLLRTLAKKGRGDSEGAQNPAPKKAATSKANPKVKTAPKKAAKAKGKPLKS